MYFRLIVIKAENVQETLQKYIKEWKITKLTFEIEPEPHRKERDKEIMECFQESGVEMLGYHSHTLYDLST